MFANLPPPPLRFARYSEIATEVAERLAALRAAGDPLAPWPEDVLVPSHGVAQGISSALLRKVPQGTAGLQLHSIDVFARRVVNAGGDFPRVATPPERRLAMRRALRAVDHPMMQSRGAAGMLERAYRDVRDSGITLADFRSRTGRTRGLRNLERTRAMIAAWTEYERLVALLGAIDPAELLSRAAARIRAGAHSVPQLIAGFYDMTGAQRQLVEALFDTNLVAAFWMPLGRADFSPRPSDFSPAAWVVPPVEGDEPTTCRTEVRHARTEVRSPVVGTADRHAAYAFADPLVRFVSSRCGETGSPVPRFLGSSGDAEAADPAAHERDRVSMTVSAIDTREDELASVCAAVAGLLSNGIDPSQIGIVGRSLEAFDERTLNRFAAAHGFRTPLTEEIPLVAHRFGRVAITLLRLRDGGFHRSDVVELLRDGLRLRTRADVDAIDVATRRARIAGGSSDELRAIRHRSAAIDAYVAVVSELEELTAIEPVALLPQVASMLSIETELDVAAAEEIEQLAALLVRTAVWGGSVDAASVTDALQNAVLTRRSDASGPLVWAGDVMRFRGRSFTHLFVVRMQDELFPQRRVEDPLLPDADRRILGLREIGDGLAEETLLNQLLIDGTSQSLHFTWAATDGFGKPLRPSRYVRRLIDGGAIRPLPTPGHQPATADPDRLQRSLQLLTLAGRGSAFDGNVPSIRTQIAARLESVSPTQLEDFGECPQKFLLKHILGVEDLDAPDRELQINPREKGTLDHRILERFYRGLSPEEIATASALLPRLPDDIVERLETLIDEAFDEHEAESPAFNATVRAIERRATRRLLRDFLATDLADLREAGLMPRHFEYRFGHKHRVPADHEEPFVVQAGDITLRVEGTVDRIDSDHERFRIVDYKSGKAGAHTNLAAKIDRGVRLQLALYAMAVSEFFSVDPAKVSATIKPLVVEGLNPSKFAFELGDKRDAVVETLTIFARSILDASFPAFPQDKDFQSCKYCPVRHSCRTRHDADERYAVLQHGDPLTLLGGGSPR